MFDMVNHAWLKTRVLDFTTSTQSLFGLAEHFWLLILVAVEFVIL